MAFSEQNLFSLAAQSSLKFLQEYLKTRYKEAMQLPEFLIS